jgi:hypothetical protein
MLSFGSLACTEIAEIPGLSKEKKADLIHNCMRSQTAGEAAVTTAPVEKISNFVSGIDEESITRFAKTTGQVVREVSKELNVAANEFIQTPLGMMVTAGVIWYVAGDEISGTIRKLWQIPGGIIVLLIPFFIVNRLLKNSLIEETSHVTVKGWFGSEKIVKRHTYMTWEKACDYEGLILVHIIGRIVQFSCFIVGMIMIF